MNDMELEELLKTQFNELPPEDYMVNDITPWKMGMKYIFWGLFLSLMGIEIFINIASLTKYIGYICLLIGFRSIRRENKFFKIGYISSLILNIRNIIYILLNTSIWKEHILEPVKEIDFIVYFIAHGLIYVCVWLGIWKVENKVGKDKNSKVPMLLPAFYVALVIMAVLNTQGIIVILWFALYVWLIVSLYKIYRTLENSGFVINASLIKIPNCVIIITMIVVTIIGRIIVNSFNKYPMAWEKYEVEHTVEIDNMKEQLINQGLPEFVVNDLSPEDIKKCAAATLVMLDVDGNVTTCKKEELLNIMSYAFCMDEKTGRLKVIHYFMWEDESTFYGTEAITYSGTDIVNGENFAGYVMYDEGDVTYKAPYYDMEYETVNSFFGPESSLFTGFSFDKKGKNCRGYLTYETECEIHENVSIDYYHQNWMIIYPAQTAWDYRIEEGILSMNDLEKFCHIRNDVSLKEKNE